METNIDCMLHRKHTHLASIDVEIIIAEKKACELTIKLAYYDRNVDVSGNQTDGYFLKFEEPVMDMVVNSGNRKKIAAMVRAEKKCSAVESRNLTNWVGFKIRLIVDENIKMMGKKVGGIVVDANYNQPKKTTLDEAKKTLKLVTTRELFEKAMVINKDFMSNSEIIEMCKELAIKYPKVK